MAEHRFFLDSNIYDLLAKEYDVCSQIRRLVDAGAVEIVASPVLVTELNRSPFGGIPAWFNVGVHPEGIAISGLARSGMARSSKGEMYKKHRGSSRKGFDAVIAHSARSMGAILVSADRRCRERLKRFAGAGSAITYDEFKSWVGEASAGGG